MADSINAAYMPTSYWYIAINDASTLDILKVFFLLLLLYVFTDLKEMAVQILFQDIYMAASLITQEFQL